MIHDLPDIALPMLPWMRLEVGSNVQKTPRLLYTRGVASFNDVVNFEVDSIDFDAGIPVTLMLFLFFLLFYLFFLCISSHCCTLIHYFFVFPCFSWK
jgi:hypothetical protein